MDDIGGVWRTIGGRRIFIKNGQDLKTAMKESGKFIKSPITGDNNIPNSLNKNSNKNVDKEMEDVKNVLTKKGVVFEEGFPKYSNKEYICKQLYALNDIIEKDEKIASVIKDHPLVVREDVLTMYDAYYSHMPDGFEEHSLNFGVMQNRKTTEEILARIESLREEKNKWISKSMSNVKNEEYVIYHEMGHLKEKIMVENYYKENPTFKEKYYKRMNKAKTQDEFSTYNYNMYHDAISHIKTETLYTIQEKNGTLKASKGRNDVSAYGEYGLKEVGEYGQSIENFELVSEGNIILSNPTKKGKESYIYKDLNNLFERWYK